MPAFLVLVIYVLQIFIACKDGSAVLVEKWGLVNPFHLWHFYLLISPSSLPYFCLLKDFISVLYALPAPEGTLFSWHIPVSIMLYCLLAWFSKKQSFYWIRETSDLTQDKCWILLQVQKSFRRSLKEWPYLQVKSSLFELSNMRSTAVYSVTTWLLYPGLTLTT